MTIDRNWTGRVFIGASLDGFIARPDGDIDWLTDPPPGPSHASVTSDAEAAGWDIFFPSIDHLVMGRGTYETVLTFDGWPYTDKRVIVMSTTLQTDDHRITIARSLAEARQALAESEAEQVYVDGGAAMFAPSPLTGRFLGAWGPRAGYGLAAMCSALAATAMLAGHDVAATVAALVLIGLSWNAAVVSTGVTLAHASLGRLDAAGLGEVLMGASGMVGTVASMLILPHLPAHHIILITTAAAAATLALLTLPSPHRQPRAS